MSMSLSSPLPSPDSCADVGVEEVGVEGVGVEGVGVEGVGVEGVSLVAWLVDVTMSGDDSVDESVVDAY